MNKPEGGHTVKQCKDKIKKLDPNIDRRSNEAGETPKFQKYYEEFDSVLGCRDITTLPEFKEIGLGASSTKGKRKREKGDENVESKPEDKEDPCENESTKYMAEAEEKKKETPKIKKKKKSEN